MKWYSLSISLQLQHLHNLLYWYLKYINKCLSHENLNRSWVRLTCRTKRLHVAALRVEPRFRVITGKRNLPDKGIGTRCSHSPAMIKYSQTGQKTIYNQSTQSIITIVVHHYIGIQLIVIHLYNCCTSLNLLISRQFLTKWIHRYVGLYHVIC